MQNRLMYTGSEVVRVTGERYQIGARGTVVEATESRLRVYWHTNPHPGTKPKRTWVLRGVVRVAPEAVNCTVIRERAQHYKSADFSSATLMAIPARRRRP